MIPVEDVDAAWEDLERADAIVFGTPTYMGGPSAQFKTFEEATSRKVMAGGFKWKDKVAAGFTNSGARSGDKLATLIQIALFAAQHGMHWVNLDLAPANNSSKGSDGPPSPTDKVRQRGRPKRLLPLKSGHAGPVCCDAASGGPPSSDQARPQPE